MCILLFSAFMEIYSKDLVCINIDLLTVQLIYVIFRACNRNGGQKVKRPHFKFISVIMFHK